MSEDIVILILLKINQENQPL